MKKTLLKLILGIAALILGSAAAKAQCVSSDTLFFTGTIDSWTVPAGITDITIEAKGAAGGKNPFVAIDGGLGAIMVGDFMVVPGAVLSVLVGEMPVGGNGGGGGTFVVDASNTPLIIAGGGGGGGGVTDSDEKYGQAGTVGGLGSNGGGSGGSAGDGGVSGSSPVNSGAGGGFYTDGDNGFQGMQGGLSYVNGGAGGYANVGTPGGFGGGGESLSSFGGGGGGYSGGGPGSNSITPGGVGGGGASFNSGSNQTNTGGIDTDEINRGNGMVIITYNNNTPDTSTILANFTITSNEVATGTTYRWLDCDNSNVAIVGETAVNYVPITNGNYAVEVTVSGCTDTSACQNITIVDVGVNETVNDPISIYPNPTQNIINVNFGNIQGVVNYTITSIEGRVIEYQQNVTTKDISIDLSNENKGIYLLKIENSTGINVYKIVRQ
jgi:hypothetical protein